MTRTITNFPARYPLTNEHVIEIEVVGWLTKEEAEADPNYKPQWVHEFSDFDFHVRLRDGRVYAFVASTPEFIREYMERESEDSFLSPGLVIVRDISETSFIDAVERWLYLGLGSHLGLEHYGCLQLADDEGQTDVLC